nr:polyubiquitin-like [Penaeus vannamei]
MVLFVKAVTGKTMTVEVTPQDTVAVLKAEMEQKAGLPVDQQRIIFGAMELENGRTLASYNIRNNDLLQQQIRLRGGGRAMFFLNVVMPSADVIQPVVNGDTAVSEVKKLLEEENPSLKGRKYRLMVAQQAMSSSKTLRDYGITSEAVVRLDLTKNVAALFLYFANVSSSFLVLENRLLNSALQLARKSVSFTMSKEHTDYGRTSSDAHNKYEVSKVYCI